MQQKLTQRVAQSAKPGAIPYQIHDVIISGFILRVQPNGKKLWKLIQHIRPDTIRVFPQVTYGMAETKVKAILSAEMSLHVLAYNLKRVINILGTGALIEAMQA